MWENVSINVEILTFKLRMHVSVNIIISDNASTCMHEYRLHKACDTTWSLATAADKSQFAPTWEQVRRSKRIVYSTKFVFRLYLQCPTSISHLYLQSTITLMFRTIV